MSNQLAALHDIAMEFVDEAGFAQKRGDELTAQLFYQKAYNLERAYALSIPNNEVYQLSRSVFLRSAATLALDCKQLEEAIELTNLALNENPHPAILPELEELKDIITNTAISIQMNSLSKEEEQKDASIPSESSLNTTEPSPSYSQTLTGVVVAADVSKQQIKIQDSDKFLHIIIVPSWEELDKVVKMYWLGTVTIELQSDEKGSKVLKSIGTAA